MGLSPYSSRRSECRRWQMDAPRQRHQRARPGRRFSVASRARWRQCRSIARRGARFRRRLRRGQVDSGAHDHRAVAETIGDRSRCSAIDIDKASDEQKRAIDRRWGILFQQGALFSSLTVGKNVEFPIREYLRLSDRLTTEIAIAKLEMVGLSPDVYREYPSELSGGMIKRVGLGARAGARSGNPVSRRADVRPRSDQRRRIRPAHPDACRKRWVYRCSW